MPTETFGHKIRRLRQKHHLNMEAMAAILGITQQTVSMYELDKTVPPMKRLTQLAAIFQVSPAFFFPSYVTTLPEGEHVPTEDGLVSLCRLEEG